MPQKAGTADVPLAFGAGNVGDRPMTRVIIASAALCLLGLGACGATTEQKAATGAIAGAIVAGPAGAAVGGAAGTAAGKASKPN